MVKKYCFLDLETTGFDSEKDSIIEVSYILVDAQGAEISRLDEVVIPGKSSLTPFITNITGIAPSELDTRGKQWEALLPTVQQDLTDAVIVGHNIDFDIQFLAANGVELTPNERIDTHELARILLVNEESYALEVLSEKYGFTHTTAHRAMSDVEASIELFEFLKQKITELPTEFLTQIKPTLEAKTRWYAKSFFLEASGAENVEFNRSAYEKKEIRTKVDVSTSFHTSYATSSPEKPMCVRIGDSVASADFLMGVADSFVKQGKQVLILSSKLAFFPEVSKFPTPEVLLAPEKLESFLANRTEMNNQETTFYIKCAYRSFLGLRGMDWFNLFFQERDYWNEVQVAEKEHPVFQQILSERSDIQILAASPRAFFRFSDLELFTDRVLLIDEAEKFAEDLLFSCAEEASTIHLLESKEEKVSVGTQFFVSRFCKEILEEKLQHKITPYPEKVLLQPGETYPAFAQMIREVENSAQPRIMAEILENSDPDVARWVIYYPERGNLRFGVWIPKYWKDKRDEIMRREKVLFYRHKFEDQSELFQSFLGISDTVQWEDSSLALGKELHIPERLMSVKDPEHNNFITEKVLEYALPILANGKSVCVNFSSQETLRKVFTDLTETSISADWKLLGEKVSGGDSKVLEVLRQQKQGTLLLTQRMIDPVLTRYEWGAVLIQKFPFAPPHPLLQSLEQWFKREGKSFWDVWTIPQVAAEFSRRISVYPGVEEVIFLDSRENTEWGKGVLSLVF